MGVKAFGYSSHLSLQTFSSSSAKCDSPEREGLLCPQDSFVYVAGSQSVAAGGRRWANLGKLGHVIGQRRMKRPSNSALEVGNVQQIFIELINS